MVVPPGIVALLKRKRAQEEVVQVPKIIPRIYKQIPKTQEEIVHDPKIIQQVPITIDLEEIVQVPTIIQQEHDEMVVDSPIPMTPEEIVHEPKIIQQEPIITPLEEKLHRRLLELEARVEGLVGTSSFVDSLFEEEVPTPTTQEEIATEPKNIQQNPMTQEEIVHESKFIQQTEVGRVLPFSPKSRDMYRHVFFHVVPSERHGWIL
jgi:hypothetical protein